MKPRSLEERLRNLANVGSENDCWTWTGYIGRSGYGKLNVGGRDGQTLGAHRVAYMVWVGPIPEGLQLDHLCRNRACINPRHLEPVTARENVLRGKLGSMQRPRLRSECTHGHPWIADNLRTDRRGIVVCKVCCADRYRAWVERQRTRAA